MDGHALAIELERLIEALMAISERPCALGRSIVSA